MKTRKRYQALKRTDCPLKLSQDWQRGEQIDIIEPLTVHNEPGFRVHNIDYCGNYPSLETAWISEMLLNSNFTPILY